MVKLVKLITGEEVIAEIVDAKKLTLKNPVKFVMSGEGVGMIPLSPFSTAKEIEIKDEHVMFVLDVEDEIKNGYNAQFGSGIVTATSTNMGIIGGN
jgi:hypothetical protein